jgi:hypothetical protein
MGIVAYTRGDRVLVERTRTIPSGQCNPLTSLQGRRMRYERAAQGYHDGLQKKLLRRYEITERFRTAFNEAAASYGGGTPGQTVPPQIPNPMPGPVGDVIPEDDPAAAHPLADFGQFRPG